MAGILTTAGIRSLGTYAGTVQNWLKSLTLRLFQNSHTPAVGDVVGDYTECTFPSYASQAWNDWGAPSLDANNNDHYAAPDHTFTCSSSATPNQVYGYFVTDGAGALVMAEANGVPGGQAMATAGSTYTITGHFYSGQILPPL